MSRGQYGRAGEWRLTISLHQSQVLVNVKYTGCGGFASVEGAQTSQAAEALIFIDTAIDGV
jgi:hypothetical protein